MVSFIRPVASLLLFALVCTGCMHRRAYNDEPRASLSARALEDPRKPQLAHRLLQPLEGRWITLTRYRPAVNADLRVTEGRSEARWILDDLFLQERAMSAPTPLSPEFHALGLIGYDPIADRYKAVWMDNQHPEIAMSMGTVDSSGRVFTFVGSHTNPISGREIQARAVVTVVSDDSHTVDIFHREGNAPEFKVVEATYTRERQG